MFFTLLIATIAFTASAYRYICHRHSLHSFILQQSSPVIVWARLALFYWYNYTHRLGHITMSQLTSQQLYTLLRPISHVASSPRHLSHSPDLHFYIYHHSLVRFACLSAKDCRTPQTVTLQFLRSCCSHTHCTAFSFWVLLLCTALIRWLSAYQCPFTWHPHLIDKHEEFSKCIAWIKACDSSIHHSLHIIGGSVYLQWNINIAPIILISNFRCLGNRSQMVSLATSFHLHLLLCCLHDKHHHLASKDPWSNYGQHLLTIKRTLSCFYSPESPRHSGSLDSENM